MLFPESRSPHTRWPALLTKQGTSIMSVLGQLLLSEHLAPEQRQQLQWEQLGCVVDYARQHSPFYADRLPQTGYTPEDFSQVELLTRADLQKNYESIKCQPAPAAHGAVSTITSSGSTGLPIKADSTELMSLFWRCFTLRDHIWNQRDIKATLATIKFFKKGKHEYPGTRAKSWGAWATTLAPSGPTVVLNSRAPVEQQAKWLTEHQPDYLLTYPSNLDELASQYERHGRPPALRQLRTLGETLQPHMREHIQRVFGAPIADMYSAQELGYIALQCPENDHYHIQEENVYVEIIKDDGSVAPPGDVGKVVLSSLHNFVTPLIRYDIGDYAVAGRLPCSCGRTHRVLDRVMGRTRNMVRLPNGDVHWPAYNPVALHALLPGAQFQLVQTAMDRVEVRVANSPIPSEPIIQKMTGIINDALGHPFELDFQAVPSVERSSGGKYEEFMSRI